MLKRLWGWLKDWGRWTGLHGYQDPAGEYHRGKTVWDWAQLLIIPGVLLVIGFLFEEQRDARDRQLASDRAQQAALEAYLGRMTDLLLEHNLRISPDQSETRDVARAQTLTTLRTLDSARKGMLIQFIADSELITGTQPVVLMRGADLRGVDLRYVGLVGANLSDVDLSHAILVGADLSEANLSHAILSEADLRGANLREADLSRASLSHAILSRASLNGADLSRASLSDANLSDVDLSFANLSFAGLFDANLSRADLSFANLSEANLSDVDLSEAILVGADLRDAFLVGADLNQSQLNSTSSYAQAWGLPDRTTSDIRPTPTP